MSLEAIFLTLEVLLLTAIVFYCWVKILCSLVLLTESLILKIRGFINERKG